MRWFALIGPCVAAVLTCSAAVPAAAATAEVTSATKLHWELQPSGTDARFRGLAAVNREVAWLGGSKGTVLRTVDGGRSWQDVSPPGAAELQFRDIEAFDARTAVALTIGEGEQSRIYRTSDGGRSWTESFRNTDPKAFYDCVGFFDRRHGLAMSDPVDGKVRVLSTEDGGRSWRVLPSAGMPDALPGEAGFAASGQCLVTSGPRDAWIATGGGAKARVFHTSDRGRTWSVSDTPLASKPTAGVFALAFRDRRTGIAIGGDFENPNTAKDALARTGDGGRGWQVPPQAPAGYRSGATWLPHSLVGVLAVGPSGSDLSLDGGRHWRQFDAGSFDTVDCTPDLSCWAAGEKGRVARLRLG
ncbi:WD40/YVTN/BNR-like repeat-containing protein [Crossiella sp. NPDC003009]